jgi:hypothetical protein
MKNFEDFLGKDNLNLNNLEKINKKYQCQTCDEYTKDSYFDEKQHIIYWFCSQKHESKVSIV